MYDNVYQIIFSIILKVTNSTMKNLIPSALLIVSIIASACTSTHITSSWREPVKQLIVNKLNKVQGVALIKLTG